MSTEIKCTPENCRRIANEEVRERYDGRFRSAFDYVNDGLLILGKDGHIRDVNRTACERLGYTRTEMLGMHITQLNAPEYETRVAERFAQIRAQGSAIFESAHRCKNGNILPVEVNVRTVELSGEPVYFSVLRDLSGRKKTERALHVMQRSVDHMGDGAFWLTRDGSVIYANDAACGMLGYSKEEMLALRVFDFDLEISAEAWPSHWEKCRLSGSRTLESTHRTKHGKSVPVEITINHTCYEGDEYHCAFVRDISKRKHEQRALKMMQFAMDNTGDAVFWATSDARIAYANTAACSALGYAPDEILSLRVFDFDPQINAERWPSHWQELKSVGARTLESIHCSRGGRLFPVEVSLNFMQFEGGEYLCAFVRDITARKQTEAKIARLAHFDSITNLPNRALLYDRMKQAIARARRQNSRLSVLFLDLDGFKQVNDNFGHHVGDDLLKAVADRLRENARDMDTIARVGGDEFIFILNDINEPGDASFVAGKVIAGLSQPFKIHGKTCQIGGSIGISMFPEDGDNMEDIIKQADDAMYLAKNNGKGNFQFAARLQRRT